MAKGLFATYHPAVCMLFFLAAICFSFCSMQPMYIIITCVMAGVYVVFLKGGRALARSFLLFVPLVAFIAILNALFNSTGATVIWRYGILNVTLEGLFYGLVIAGMLIAVLLWFSCYNEVMTEDKFTYLFGRAVPTLSLMVSMVSRWVPRMASRGRSIYDSQEALIGGYDTTKRGAISRGLRMATVLAGLGMEDSIQTSDSMRARGYGTARRTSYARYRWHARERVVLVVLIVLAVVNAVGMVMGTMGFDYYPTIVGLRFVWWGYATYALMLALPLLVELERAFK